MRSTFGDWREKNTNYKFSINHRTVFPKAERKVDFRKCKILINLITVVDVKNSILIEKGLL